MALHGVCFADIASIASMQSPADTMDLAHNNIDGVVIIKVSLQTLDFAMHKAFAVMLPV